jgi:hypothetical protein
LQEEDGNYSLIHTSREEGYMFKKFFAAGVILVAGVASAMAAGTDTGVVNDQSGNPVAGAVVTYTRAPNQWTDTTNAQGVYRFKLGVQSLTVIGSSADTGNFVASKIGYFSSTPRARLIVVADTQGNALIGQALPLTLDIQSTSGTIVDSSTSVAISGARVQEKRAGVIVDSAFSNSQGQYSLSLVATGDTLIVTAPSYLTKYAVEPAFSSGATANTINFSLSPFGTVAGSVDSLFGGGGPIKGATVSIATVVNGVAQAPFAVTTTDSTGHYMLDSIAAHYSYKVAASAPSFSPKSGSITYKSIGVDTVNFMLGPATSAFQGTVKSDNGTLLVGAKIVLKKGASTAAIDSTVTDSVGIYSFSHDSVGVSYTITASYNGFQTLSKDTTKTFDTDAVNFVLVPGSMKTFWVKVLGTASAPLANASVGFTNGTSVIGGLTNVHGIFQVNNAPVGFDSITVADSLYSAQLNFVSSSAYSADTVTYTLTQVATGTVQRAIRGTAHEVTTTGVPASGAQIVFKCAGGYVFAATSLTNGTWSVVGIPDAIPATGSIPVYDITTGLGLDATLSSVSGDTVFNPFNNTAAIDIAATGVTTYNSIVFTVQSVGVLPEVANKTTGEPTFSVLRSAGIISLKNMTEPGIVRVYNLLGQMVYNHAFEANTVSLHVPALSQGKTAFIVSITQNKAVYKQLVVMP